MYNNEMLRQIRERKKITQAQMAKALGYSDPSGYTKIETVGVDIPLTKVQVIKEVLSLNDKQIKEIFFKGDKRGKNA